MSELPLNHEPDSASSPAATARVPVWAWWTIALAALVVLGGAGAVIWASESSGDSVDAREIARSYVDAIADGDAETANALSRVDERDPATRLLRSDALQEAEHITDVEVGRLRVDPDRGTAVGTVDFRINDRHFDSQIALARDDDGWFVRDGIAVEVSLLWYGEEPPFSVEGFDAVILSDESLMAYPAVYRVVAPNEYFEVDGPDQWVVGTDDVGGYAGPYAEQENHWTVPTAAYWDEVHRQSDAWFDDCAEEDTVEGLAECGIEFSASADLWVRHSKSRSNATPRSWKTMTGIA